jgi:hypothetical protein
MKKTLLALLLPVAFLATGCQQTTVHTHSGSAALAGVSSVSPAPTRTTAAAAGASATAIGDRRISGVSMTTAGVAPAPQPAPTPSPAKKPAKREVYEEQTSEVVETYVFPASDEEMGR